MFGSLVIANRGEIACRIIRTAQRLGMRTIAVYSDADEQALHVSLADEAHPIGPAQAAESYLKSDTLIDVAVKARADAIHPGYGFLAENEGFAEACQKAGITFVGPSPDAIRVMGQKDQAKALMEKAGIAVVPGYYGADQSPKVLAHEAQQIGFPVLIKAISGGGGKGMRRVDDAASFADALAAAQREAQSSFGDQRVLIEKYLVRPRHIEMQVFADRHGNAVHMFERDCSLQRRHQKIIEEAPAPGLSDAFRASMAQTAIRAVKAIGYEGAGTIEFIIDVSNGLSQGQLYFMEMNTRLQVEHPVTEMITGVDLVEWQLRIAAGETLPCRQDELSVNGHAMEARIYAEDPAKSFMPSPGQIRRLRLPKSDSHIRIDTGIRENDMVSRFYDPMIGKIIAWGDTRAEALARLQKALRQTQIAGLRHNIGFLARLCDQSDFRNGDVDTHLIDRHLRALSEPPEQDRQIALLLAALYVLRIEQRRQDKEAAGSKDTASPWRLKKGWRLFGQAQEVVEFRMADGEPFSVRIIYTQDGFQMTIGQSSFAVHGHIKSDGTIEASVDGTAYGAGSAASGSHLDVILHGETFELTLVDPFHLEESEAIASDNIIAPLPGRISSVHCKKGERVIAGAPVLVLEAMKMEHTMTAPKDGIIAELLVDIGDQVDEGSLLVRLDLET